MDSEAQGEFYGTSEVGRILRLSPSRVRALAASGELEAAGWEQLDVQGKTLWVNPESGHRYPQGPAIRRLRQQRQEDADRGDA